MEPETDGIEGGDEDIGDEQGSVHSDGPGDGIMIAPAVSLSAISFDSSSSYVTSSEDDHAISDGPSGSISDSSSGKMTEIRIHRKNKLR